MQDSGVLGACPLQGRGWGGERKQLQDTYLINISAKLFASENSRERRLGGNGDLTE